MFLKVLFERGGDSQLRLQGRVQQSLARPWVKER